MPRPPPEHSSETISEASLTACARGSRSGPKRGRTPLPSGFRFAPPSGEDGFAGKRTRENASASLRRECGAAYGRKNSLIASRPPGATRYGSATLRRRGCARKKEQESSSRYGPSRGRRFTSVEGRGSRGRRRAPRTKSKRIAKRPAPRSRRCVCRVRSRLGLRRHRRPAMDGIDQELG